MVFKDYPKSIYYSTCITAMHSGSSVHEKESIVATSIQFIINTALTSSRIQERKRNYLLSPFVVQDESLLKKDTKEHDD